MGHYYKFDSVRVKTCLLNLVATWIEFTKDPRASNMHRFHCLNEHQHLFVLMFYYNCSEWKGRGWCDCE